jgi:pimeloyl-ACP methyl ester carboxylesterase
MPQVQLGDASIYYEVHGQGFPLLLIAPGGMRSSVDAWSQFAPFNAIEQFKGEVRVIAMDQRNAGGSRAPIAEDDWATYAADQAALLDHLGVERFHVIGGCIGCSYALALIASTGGRVASAVLQNPIGLANGNRRVFFGMVEDWARELQANRPVDSAPLAGIAPRMFAADFVFSVTRDFVSACTTPLLVLPGNDDFHPTATAREIADLAPAAEYLDLGWREPQSLPSTVDRVRSFLRQHTP